MNRHIYHSVLYADNIEIDFSKLKPNVSINFNKPNSKLSEFHALFCTVFTCIFFLLGIIFIIIMRITPIDWFLSLNIVIVSSIIISGIATILIQHFKVDSVYVFIARHNGFSFCKTERCIKIIKPTKEYIVNNISDDIIWELQGKLSKNIDKIYMIKNKNIMSLANIDPDYKLIFKFKKLSAGEIFLKY